MANTLTPIHSLKKPAWKDGRWDVPTNDDWDLVDGLLPPKGGDTGDVLTKTSDLDNEVAFLPPSGGGGGLAWETTAVDTVPAENGKGYLIDTTASGCNVGLPASPEVGWTIGIGDWKGTCEDHSIVIIPDTGDLIMGSAESLELNTNNQNITLVYANATQGWKIVETTPFCSGNPLIANKPVFHAQEQKPTGEVGHNYTGGEEDVILNTVLTNEITGASLASNEITLPAGKYYASGQLIFSISTVDTVCRLSVRDTAGNVLVIGVSKFAATRFTGEGYLVSGQFELTTTTVITLSKYDNKGGSFNPTYPAITNQAPYEVYSDFKIWALNQEIQVPTVSSPPVTAIAGVPVTGNIYGLEYAMSSGEPLHTIDVGAGTCMDGTGLEEMVLAAGVGNGLVIPSAINTIYSLFVTKTGGVVGVAQDTDVNGSNIVADYKRWIGFVRTNSLGDICIFTMDGMVIYFSNFEENKIGDLNSTITTYSIDLFIPVSRVLSIDLSSEIANPSYNIMVYTDEGVEVFVRSSPNLANVPVFLCSYPASDVTIRVNSTTTGKFYIITATLKR